MFAFPKRDEIWILGRHGERMKREGAIEHDGESSSVHYRPESFDVLIYHPKEGILEINTKNKGERKKYCQILSEHLFGDEDFIPYDESQRFTLQPIVEGPDCLVCADVPGMEWVQLREIKFVVEKDKKRMEVIFRSERCLFDEFDDYREEFPTNGNPVKASFKVFFSETKSWRIVTVESPNATSFDREMDHRAVDHWLAKRGFLVKRTKPAPSNKAKTKGKKSTSTDR